MRVALVLVLVAAAASVARAEKVSRDEIAVDPPGPPPSDEHTGENGDPGLVLELLLQGGAATDGTALRGPGLIVAGQMRSIMIGVDEPLAIAPELQLGFGTGGGFRYDLAFPLGMGAWFGDGRFAMAAMTGVGVGGMTGDRLPIAFELPAEGVMILSPIDRLNLVASARADFVFGAAERKHGATTAPVDELTFRLDVILGAREPRSDSNSDARWTIGAMEQEVRGGRVLWLMFGAGSLSAPMGEGR
ncbi:MAG TPA: hypothetical protein VL463_34625 [Kofleriaceae bacterium]|nr:hypothetical protein [Kofleriaceae bacterium]